MLLGKILNINENPFQLKLRIFSYLYHLHDYSFMVSRSEQEMF